MLFKYFYDESLAHASYLVGCQKTGEAIIVDPGRDIEPYLKAATAEGMAITGVAETHIHADYVSGARELAHQVGATLFVSDEGPENWKYDYAASYDHRLLKEGDTFSAGNIEFQVLHTPGHTPESISFLLTDKGGGADLPLGIFTGDFVFVGSIGRPDLLEEAAGIAGTAEPGARDLFKSIKRFNQLPEYLQVWPAHGAGSACGKGLGSIPSSTVGYEKRFNPALQFTDEEAFVQYILSDQPEAPKYFALMKKVNKEGPELIGQRGLPEKLNPDLLPEITSKQMVVDTADSQSFAAGHVPGTINLQSKYLAMWGGSLIDYDQPIFLITRTDELTEVIRIMRKIGIENFGGYFDAEEVASASLLTESITQESPEQVFARFNTGEIEIVDVRGSNERNELSIPGSIHAFLAKLPQEVDRFQDDKVYVFQCRNGARSIIAASIARRAGVKNIVNLAGGINAWAAAGLPLTSELAESIAAS